MNLRPRDWSTRKWRVVVPATVAIALFAPTERTDRVRSDRVAFALPFPARNLPAHDARQSSIAGQAGPVEVRRPAIRHDAVLDAPTARAAAYGRLPLAFERNVGQTDPRVQFLSRGNGYTFFLTADAAVLSMERRTPADAPTPKDGAPIGARSTAAVRLQFLGASNEARIEASDQLSSVTNYFGGGDPSRWHAGVPNYARISQRDVYPGIDIVYYGNQRQLEYDFVVAPGADPGVIAFEIDGANALHVDKNGNLIVDLPGGQMSLKKPFAYQEIDGAGGPVREIPVAYVIGDSHDVRLAAAAYDHDKTLIIDPVLMYGSYLGGTSLDGITGLALDAAGNAYVSGATGSVEFPTTVGAPQSAYGGGSGAMLGLPTDAFVAKMNASGSALLYSTYLGGADDDLATSIAVDDAGNAYVTGTTKSGNFPTTSGAFQPAYAGGDKDAFVVKLGAAGALSYATYLGSAGQGSDEGNAIAVDSAGNAYVTGDVESDGFPTTTGAFQVTFGGAIGDTFITKINPTGSALVFSTYLGGLSDDVGTGIAVDGAGNVFVAGRTASSDFPTTPDAWQTSLIADPDCSNPCYDAFVTKLNASGTALVYSTFVGGDRTDEASSIAIDSAGNAYVVGLTRSATFPATSGAFQATVGDAALAGPGDAFVSKINPAGSSLVSSTFLGGIVGDRASAVAVDAKGYVYVTGSTASFNFPTTPGAAQATHGGGSGGTLFCQDPCDAFLARLTPNLSTLVYSTYLGGAGDDSTGGLRLDADANVYIAGFTSSSDFPTTSGAFQEGMPAGGVSAQWGGSMQSSLEGDPANAVLFLQRNGAGVTGSFGERGWTLSGTQTSETGGTFNYDITVDRGSLCCSPEFTGTMTVDTVNNTLEATISGYNDNCELDIVTLALNRIDELASGFLFKLNVAPAAAGDHDGDRSADISVFRPSTGTWFTRQSTTLSLSTAEWGTSTDVPVPGDYDGDGRIDVAVFRPGEGTWYILQSSTAAVSTIAWGSANIDLPVPADYDGDGRTDIAVFRPSAGAWYILRSATSTILSAAWGDSTDLPVAHDYDGDGSADIAVYRPSTGTWFILQSSTAAASIVEWGGAGTDQPVPADYDGDGKVDIAVFRPSAGTWYILQSSTATFLPVVWGDSSDIPVPADYDGDGSADVAVYRPGTGTWFILQSSTAAASIVGWGGAGDIPANARP